MSTRTAKPIPFAPVRVARQAKTAPVALPYLFCVERGEKLREVKDQTCGRLAEFADVYACSVFGECTLRRYLKHGQEMADCLHCRKRRVG